MICIDLYAGLGGWTEGFLAEGHDVLGFDIEARPYPAQLVLQDVLTIHGAQFRDATCIVASPPCQVYSYMAMPWTRAKALIAWHRENPERIKKLNALFDACFRLQYEACQAAGRYIPMVVENVKGAQPWVGSAKWHYGSYYLWGDVPALMPFTSHRKVPGMNFHEHEKTGHPGRSFQSAAVEHTKNNGGSWFAQAHNTESGHGQNPDGRKVQEGSKRFTTGLGRGHDWRQDPSGRFNSKSLARKAASAQIAKIPFPLAQHIARVFKTA